MAGHSKWSNIKHRKAKSDAEKAKIFTKIGREITVAVKAGGSDIDANPRLRDLVTKARANNIPNDNITRCIKKAAGDVGNVNYETIIYEGYAPGGIAVIVETLTDNKNRTAADVRHIFDKNGGSLGTSGCVAYLFDNKGVVILKRPDGAGDDAVMLAALEAGAEDVSFDGDIYEVLCAPNDLGTVTETLKGAGYEIESSETDMIPQNTVTPDEESQKLLEKMIDMLDDNEDVNNYYHNALLPDGE